MVSGTQNTVRSIEVLKSLDWVLAGAALLLVLLSLAVLVSSAIPSQEWTSSRFVKQSFAAIVSLIAAFVIAKLPYHSLRRYALLIYGIALLGLITVFLTGQVIRGTVSRLEIAGLQIQPSEFMKVALVITLAWFLSRTSRLSWRQVIISALMLAAPILLIAIEPDLGVAMLLLALWASLLVFSGLSWSAISGLSVIALAAALASWRWLLADYQQERLLIFLDPSRDPLGAGYNILQSIVALGSGRIVGRGLGHGPQSQLEFLPERHTDFILSSIGEELGFIGVFLILLLYGILLWRILRIAQTTNDNFGRLLATGTFTILLISLTVSAGMNMGLIPVTGIPLPMLSYGGSSLLSTFVLLGLVQSVHVYSKWAQSPPMEITNLT